MHVVDIEEDAKVHYHKKLTEIYFILAGSGQMELEGEKVPVEPFTAILIKPGCRHRAAHCNEKSAYGRPLFSLPTQN